MTYNKFKFLALMGRKLLWPIQLRKLTNYAISRLTVPFARRWGPDKLIFSPPNIMIAVTARCDKKCDFCLFRSEMNPDDANKLELTYEKFLDFIRHPLVVDSLRISFVGGEPLLNKDLFKMIRETKRCGHIASIVTNGRLLRKRYSEVLENPPDLLTISYYPEDREQLTDTLPLFSGTIPMKINFLLSESRLAEAENVLRLAVAVKALFVDFEHMLITSTIASNEQPVREDDEKLQQLKSRLNKKYGRQVLINWRRPLPKADKKKIVNCRVFWHSLQLDAMGRISPCCQWPLSTYQDNIFTNANAWNSKLMRSLRKQIRNGNVHNYCKKCPALYEDYLGI